MVRIRRMLFALAIPSLVSAQANKVAASGKARLLGIYDSHTGAPVAGVEVRDAFTGTHALTSETGTVSLGFLTYRGDAALVQLRKLGYDPKQIILTLGDTVPITETLDRVVTLAPVVTTEQYRVDRDPGEWEGFERRCHAASITCFRASDMAIHPAENLADLLQHAKGVVIGGCSNDRSTSSAANSRGSQCGKIAMHSTVIPPAYCQPTVFVNGFEWSSQMGNATDLVPGEPPQAPYTPTNVKAVEVYPATGTRPLRFMGNPMCGAIVIWTK